MKEISFFNITRIERRTLIHNQHLDGEIGASVNGKSVLKSCVSFPESEGQRATLDRPVSSKLRTQPWNYNQN